MHDTGNPPIYIRIPDTIGPELIRDAVQEKRTVQAQILWILHVHYGKQDEYVEPRRGRPRAQ